MTICWRKRRFSNGPARQVGTAWHTAYGHRVDTAWTPVTAAQQEWAKDPARFDGVRALGVDEHMWHRVSRRERGPQERTGMVDAIRDLGQR